MVYQHCEANSFGDVGFTSQLKATLTECDEKIDTWRRTQIANADKRAASARAQLLTCQDDVDRTCVDLVTLQLSQGLGLQVSNASPELNNGAVPKSASLPLSEQVRNLDEQKDVVLGSIETKKQRIQGKRLTAPVVGIKFLYCNFLKILLVRFIQI